MRKLKCVEITASCRSFVSNDDRDGEEIVAHLASAIDEQEKLEARLKPQVTDAMVLVALNNYYVEESQPQEYFSLADFNDMRSAIQAALEVQGE